MAWVSAVFFAVGTAVVMLAPTMEVFLAGRLIEGFGAGAIDVVLYVLVARIFPAELHGPVFAGFAAAWVVPALIGPALAGIVTDTWNWHWVFAGALVIALAAFVLLVPTLGRLHPPAAALRPPWQRVRIGWSVAAAVSILLLNVAPDLTPWGMVAAVVVGLVGTWFCPAAAAADRHVPGRGRVAVGRAAARARRRVLLRERGVRAVPAAGRTRAVTVGCRPRLDGGGDQLGRVELGARPPGGAAAHRPSDLRGRTHTRAREPGRSARGGHVRPVVVGAGRRLVRRRRGHGGDLPPRVDADPALLG
ncbi:MFS transporter [Curtobacterium flaccumfaciens]|nr:MFS transporter [Curtobacterium flaccumfaciens]